jgi:translation initiation factor 2 alpha subunit (eIF-2alpha)
MKKKLNQEFPREEVLWAIFNLFSEIHDALKQLHSHDEEWYDQADVKKILKVGDSSLYRMRKEGKLPYVKIGGKIYYKKSFFNNAFKK